MKFFCATFLTAALLPLFAFAQVAPATIITRAGNVTAPLKYYIDKESLRSALATGVNHSIKVTVTAQNESKEFAEQFETVQLFDDAGALIGRNVALKSDALSTNRYSFIFKNFGIADLSTVAGVQITFFPVGGNNPTDKITVSGVTISLERENGEACIIADPITIITPEKPPPTVRDIQTARPLVQPGTHGDGGSGGSGGGGTPTSQGPNYPSSASNSGSGTISWSNPTNVYANDGANAIASTGTTPHQTQNLDATGFGFGSIPLTATINGIVAEVNRGVSPGTVASDAVVYLIQGGSTISNNLATALSWPTGYGVATYGSSSNIATDWGNTITATHVTATTFGFRISAMITSSTQAHIDYVRITVYYTPAGGSVYDSFMDLITSLARKISCRVAPSVNCSK